MCRIAIYLAVGSLQGAELVIIHRAEFVGREHEEDHFRRAAHVERESLARLQAEARQSSGEFVDALVDLGEREGLIAEQQESLVGLLFGLYLYRAAEVAVAGVGELQDIHVGFNYE